MAENKKSIAEIFGAILGVATGFTLGAIVNTYVGLIVLQYFGWLPF